MRTIKFKGKRLDNGEWVYGELCTPRLFDSKRGYFGEDAPCVFCDEGNVPIIPESIGQFTGLLDKNGKEIYEGDILSTDLAIPRCEVVFRNGCFALRLNDGHEDFYDIISPIDESVDKTNYHTIIGSIHDHPELLNEK